MSRRAKGARVAHYPSLLVSSKKAQPQVAGALAEIQSRLRSAVKGEGSDQVARVEEAVEGDCWYSCIARGFGEAERSLPGQCRVYCSARQCLVERRWGILNVRIELFFDL